MLSGIGPRAELERHGIAVVADLPGVGENLQDHLDVFVEVQTRTRHAFSLRPGALWRNLRNIFRHLLFRTGELTSNVAEAGGFFRTTPDQKIPDMQWHLVASANTLHALDLRPALKRYAYSVMNYFLRPYSRGRVGLASADPLAAPRIDFNYGADLRDIDALVAGVRATREVLRHAPIAGHGQTEIAPGLAVQTDEELRAWVRATAETAYHPVGTCRMGAADDPLAVVDPRLRVRGLEGLRVVDAFHHADPGGRQHQRGGDHDR